MRPDVEGQKLNNAVGVRSGEDRRIGIGQEKPRGMSNEV
jgi:hypothetical protein